MPRCSTDGWVLSMHRAWILCVSETALISNARRLSWTATFAPRGKLSSLLTARQPTTRSADLSTVLRRPDGPFTPVAIGGYTYISKITNEYAKWTTVFLLTNKNQALQSNQLFVGSTAIPIGGRTVRWRANKGSGYTGEEVWWYCLETGIIQEFTATNMPQHIGVSQCV